MINFKPGTTFPDIQVSTRDANETSLIPRINDVGDNEDNENATWYAVFVYRGRHCPICAKFLNELQQKLERFKKINTKVIAVSADSVEQLNSFYEEDISKVEFPVYAGLKTDVMQNMGLFMSEPMSSNETDHLFAEPALFVVNPKREIQIVEIANAPFVRPQIDQLISGLEFIQNNDYPIRGIS